MPWNREGACGSLVVLPKCVSLADAAAATVAAIYGQSARSWTCGSVGLG